MDEMTIKKNIALWFNNCTNEQQVIEMQDIISDISKTEAENRIYDLEK